MMITCSAHARDGESDFGEYDDIADDYELLMMMVIGEYDDDYDEVADDYDDFAEDHGDMQPAQSMPGRMVARPSKASLHTSSDTIGTCGMMIEDYDDVDDGYEDDEEDDEDDEEGDEDDEEDGEDGDKTEKAEYYLTIPPEPRAVFQESLQQYRQS